MTVCAYSTRFRHLEAGECLCQPARKRKHVRGGVAAGQRRARGPRTHTAGHSRSSTECSRRGSLRSSANAPGGTGGVVATATRGNKARRAGDISASRDHVQASVRRGEVGGRQRPLRGVHRGRGRREDHPPRGGGAVERRASPQIQPARVSFFGNPTAPRVPCAVARRKARGRSRNVAFSSFFFAQKPTLFSSLSAPLGASRLRTRVRASSSHATLTPRHSLRDTRYAPPAPPPSRRPSPCWRSARRCCTRRWRRS
jgi:hypothetical protein